MSWTCINPECRTVYRVKLTRCGRCHQPMEETSAMPKITNANGPSNNPDLAAGGLSDGRDPEGQNANEAEFAEQSADEAKLASPLDVPNSTEHPVSERYADLGPGVVSTTIGSGPDVPVEDAVGDEAEPEAWPATRATVAEWRKALLAAGVDEAWVDQPDPDDAPGKALTKDQMQGVAHGIDSGELRLNDDGVPVENDDYDPDADAELESGNG